MTVSDIVDRVVADLDLDEAERAEFYPLMRRVERFAVRHPQAVPLALRPGVPLGLWIHYLTREERVERLARTLAEQTRERLS